MGWWEMLVARMVAWLVQRHLMRPRPLLRILSLEERGGSSGGGVGDDRGLLGRDRQLRDAGVPR